MDTVKFCEELTQLGFEVLTVFSNAHQVTVKLGLGEDTHQVYYTSEGVFQYEVNNQALETFNSPESFWDAISASIVKYLENIIKSIFEEKAKLVSMDPDYIVVGENDRIYGCGATALQAFDDAVSTLQGFPTIS